MLLNEIINSYQSSAELAALSLNTKRTYNQYLGQIKGRTVGLHLTVLPTTLHPMQIDVASLSRVVSQFNGPQAQRMARRLLVLTLSWAQNYGLIGVNPASRIPLAKLSTKPRKPFTIVEVSLLQGLLGQEDVPLKFKPYIAQAVVAFHTGMRPSELDNLVWPDVGTDFINVRSAKHHEVGAVSRMVRVTEGVVSVLPPVGKGNVFKSVAGKPLNKDTRSEAIHYACTKVGIEPREFYSTRRGTATEMFKAGYDIAAIQHQLGHRDISTTQIYIKPSMEQAASVFRGF